MIKIIRDSQTKRSFSQSLSSSLIVKKKSSKKEGKSGKKNSSAKLKTPKKSDKKEKKNKLSHSLRNIESQGSLKKNKSLKNFNETSPYKNSKKVLGYSARTLNQVLGENRKPLSIHGTLICNIFNCKTELECSPRFSNAPSPMKPKLLEKKI